MLWQVFRKEGLLSDKTWDNDRCYKYVCFIPLIMVGTASDSFNPHAVRATILWSSVNLFTKQY